MFNFLSKNIFKYHYKISFKFPIWKIIPAQSDNIVCETRDIEHKITTYHNIDLKSGKLRWQDVSLEENWWIGIDGVYDDVIVFHKYERPDFPIHQAIIAMDLFTKTILWKNPNYRLLTVQEPFLYVVSSSNDLIKYLQIEIKSGNIIKEFHSEEFASIIKNLDNRIDNVLYPENVYLHNTNNAIIEKYFVKYKETIYDEIEILYVNNFYILGYSLVNTNQDKVNYSDFISVVDNNSRELFKDKLISDVNQVVFPKFLFKTGYLIYIQNKSILNVCKLYENIH